MLRTGQNIPAKPSFPVCAQPELSGTFPQSALPRDVPLAMPPRDPPLKDLRPRDKPPVARPPAATGGLQGQAQALAMIRTALIEKKMTQAELADASDCHEKTIQNMLAGKSVRQQTLFDVCMVLGLDYPDLQHLWHGGGPLSAAIDHDRSAGSPNGRPSTPDTSGQGGEIAPVYMGAYSRAGVDHYLGSYLTLRPAFSQANLIIAYRTDVTWDPGWPSLLFEERDRPDAPYAHRGRLYIPASSQFIHLVSLTKGAMRMIVVSQIDRGGMMRGLITTLNKRRAQFVPVSAPIVYVKQTEFVADALGEIAADHAAYGRYRAALADAIDQGYASLVGLADHQ
jgi:DNA-binding Xre family transcriptional regulator